MADKKNNTGYNNSGYCNSGDYNSGTRNSGYSNSGNYNSGYSNSGNYNSGDYNSGYSNSGNRNSGDYNSGDYNSGNYNSGDFNTSESTIRMFNKDTGKMRDDNCFKQYYKIKYKPKPRLQWVASSRMSDFEKQENPSYETTNGYLKDTGKIDYSPWNNEQDLAILKALPNFCPKIFKEITGIDVEAQSCDGKVVEIDGKKYKLTEVE